MDESEATCMGHMHVTMQCVHFNDRRFGKVIITDTEDEAFVVANALMASPGVDAIYGGDIDIWLS